MVTSPVLSVVVPAFDNGGTLAETLDSVLAQEGVDFELIVADHSSTDDTRAVMERYADDPRVRLMTTEAGGGAGRNWNAVTAAASGELIKL
ncbi:MAG: glycosyltransferase family 2 protein, partial [Microbacterium sp.]|nr:glycosyltransferase family 2 protein [Microbacterium sp.]